MEPLDWKSTVVVLDLDDTLYNESDYRSSGISAVCRCVDALYGECLGDAAPARLDGDSDWIGAICQWAALAPTAKESLLWIYRLHFPAIHLTEPTRNAVNRLEKQSRATVILTDGRSVTQRLKLKALGLDHLVAYISEDYASEKPDGARFRQIMQDFEAETYLYVGDNPQKDFIAPNALGWITIGLRSNGRNIHSQACDGLPPENLPGTWIGSLDELLG